MRTSPGADRSALAAAVSPPVGQEAASPSVSPFFVLLLDGLSFVVLLILVLIAVPPGTAAVSDTAVDTSSGWTILRRVPVAAWLFAVVFCFDLFYMPVEVALPLLVRGPLHGSGSTLGALWTSFGIGALIGALATNHLRRLSQITLLVAIIAAWAGCVGVLGLAPNVAVAATAFAIGGLIDAPFTPVAYSLVQSRLGPDQQQPVITLWARWVGGRRARRSAHRRATRPGHRNPRRTGDLCSAHTGPRTSSRTLPLARQSKIIGAS
jgi:hypothetical protein